VSPKLTKIHQYNGESRLLRVGASEGGDGERVERERLTGIWRGSSQRGLGAEPLVSILVIE